MINEKGEQLGTVSREEALRLAKEHGLDLVLITNKTDPPVCKLVDYGKFLYQQKKKEKKAKISQVKGVRLRFNISPHDIETKAKQAKNFLEKGDKIKVEMILRGREKALSNFARNKIEKFLEALNSYLTIETEQGIKRTPRGLITIIKKKL